MRAYKPLESQKLQTSSEEGAKLLHRDVNKPTPEELHLEGSLLLPGPEEETLLSKWKVAENRLLLV